MKEPDQSSTKSNVFGLPLSIPPKPSNRLTPADQSHEEPTPSKEEEHVKPIEPVKPIKPSQSYEINFTHTGGVIRNSQMLQGAKFTYNEAKELKKKALGSLTMGESRQVADMMRKSQHSGILTKSSFKNGLKELGKAGFSESKLRAIKRITGTF